MRNVYRSVMDVNVNPLKDLPASHRFQLMVMLSFMWTIVFCTCAGAWFWFGELVVLHVLLVLLATLITSYTFQTARLRTYRDHPARDGTTRYDDVWGA